MNLITKAEASRILGISEVAIHHWQNKNPRPDFFVEDENGNLRIDADKESWKAKLNGARKTGHAKKTLDGMNKKRELKKIVSSAVDGVEDDGEPASPRGAPPDPPPGPAQGPGAVKEAPAAGEAPRCCSPPGLPAPEDGAPLWAAFSPQG